MSLHVSLCAATQAMCWSWPRRPPVLRVLLPRARWFDARQGLPRIKLFWRQRAKGMVQHPQLPQEEKLLNGLAHWLLGLLLWYCFNMFQSITGRITSAVWLLASAWIYKIFDGIAAGFEWRLSLEQSTQTKNFPIPHSDLELRWKLRFHQHRWLHQYDWLLIGLRPLIFVYVCQIIVILVRLWAGHIRSHSRLTSLGLWRPSWTTQSWRPYGALPWCWRRITGALISAKKARRSFSYIFRICLVCSILDIFFQNWIPLFSGGDAFECWKLSECGPHAFEGHFADRTGCNLKHLQAISCLILYMRHHKLFGPGVMAKLEALSVAVKGEFSVICMNLGGFGHVSDFLSARPGRFGFDGSSSGLCGQIRRECVVCKECIVANGGCIQSVHCSKTWSIWELKHKQPLDFMSHVYIPRSSTLFKISFVLRRPTKNCRQPSVGEKMLLRCILKDYLIIEAFDVLRF